MKFRDLIMDKTGHKVLKCEPDLEYVKLLSGWISEAEPRRFTAKRVNELNDRVVLAISNSFYEATINYSWFNYIIMKKTTYPDIICQFVPGPKTFYLEVKIREQKDELSSLRCFYITEADEVKTDGYHIVIDVVVKKGNTNWLVKEFQLIDLYDVDMNLKVEYNANQKQLLTEKNIIA